MRAVVQRVSKSKVTVNDEVTGDDKVTGEIQLGLLVLLGVEQGDADRDLQYTLNKVVGLRVFEDSDGKMNRSVADVGGSLLVVSQFTLLGDVRKGKRPSFVGAAPPDEANTLFEKFVEQARATGLDVQTGIFQATMSVELINEGPVTILIDSRKTF